MNKIQPTFSSIRKQPFDRIPSTAITYPTFSLSKEAVIKINGAYKEHENRKTTKLENITDLDTL